MSNSVMVMEGLTTNAIVNIARGAVSSAVHVRIAVPNSLKRMCSKLPSRSDFCDMLHVKSQRTLRPCDSTDSECHCGKGENNQYAERDAS